MSREYTGYGFRCCECGDQPDRTDSWRRCGEQRFCSLECAVEFLLRREALR